MSISSIFICFWIFLTLPKCCWLGRGVIADLDEETFEMLIAGGYQIDNSNMGRHVVSIRTLNKIRYNGDNHFCTGVVISSRVILTAAHCLTDKYKSVMNPRGVLVVFGKSRRIGDFKENESRRVNRIIVHPKYKRFLKHDLALMRLTDRLPPDMMTVRPIRRRNENRFNLTVGMQCITMGWGQVYRHGPYSDDMLFLDVRISEHERCEKYLKYYEREGNVCAMPMVQGEVCPGDLGGPLICHDSLAGIIGGTQKCDGTMAIKFVNFMYYEDWAYKTMSLMIDEKHREVHDYYQSSSEFRDKWPLLVYTPLFTIAYQFI